MNAACTYQTDPHDSHAEWVGITGGSPLLDAEVYGEDPKAWTIYAMRLVLVPVWSAYPVSIQRFGLGANNTKDPPCCPTKDQG